MGFSRQEYWSGVPSPLLRGGLSREEAPDLHSAQASGGRGFRLREIYRGGGGSGRGKGGRQENEDKLKEGREESGAFPV